MNTPDSSEIMKWAANAQRMRRDQYAKWLKRPIEDVVAVARFGSFRGKRGEPDTPVIFRDPM